MHTQFEHDAADDDSPREGTSRGSTVDPLGGTPLRAIIGPTAVGKSALALAVAERARAEIVSLDSMQVYRGMDVGTAKSTPAERARVPHHMLDLVDPHERFDVQQFLAELARVLAELRARDVRALFVGGTGFYLKAVREGLFDGPPTDLALRARLQERVRAQGLASVHAELVRVDPDSARRIHPNDEKRVLRALEVHEQMGERLSSLQRQWDGRARPDERIVGLQLATPELDRRIASRARTMLERGWPAEAARIRADRGFGPSAVQALGYTTALALHDGVVGIDDAAREIALATRQFARRQRTWYRKFDVCWLEPGTDGAPLDERLVEATLRALGW